MPSRVALCLCTFTFSGAAFGPFQREDVYRKQPASIRGTGEAG